MRKRCKCARVRGNNVPEVFVFSFLAIEVIVFVLPPYQAVKPVHEHVPAVFDDAELHTVEGDKSGIGLVERRGFLDTLRKIVILHVRLTVVVFGNAEEIELAGILRKLEGFRR